ncbi:unnamed protein product [Caenorhabditis sp. 36 PRJEB53466]|nr:unnamed protein product [Caenorhabditis sp. 36 PRJEB53466]
MADSPNPVPGDSNNSNGAPSNVILVAPAVPVPSATPGPPVDPRESPSPPPGGPPRPPTGLNRFMTIEVHDPTTNTVSTAHLEFVLNTEPYGAYCPHCKVGFEKNVLKSIDIQRMVRTRTSTLNHDGPWLLSLPVLNRCCRRDKRILHSCSVCSKSLSYTQTHD